MNESNMSESEDEMPDHPDGLPFPKDGIQAEEGPNGHQRITGEAAQFIQPGFEEVLKVVVEVAYQDIGDKSRSYRTILQDQGGDIHLGGGGDEYNWIDLDYGWEDALAEIEDFIQPNPSEEQEDTSFEILEGEEAYRKLRSQLN